MRWKSLFVSFMIVAGVALWMAGGNIGNEAVREAAEKREAKSQAQNNAETKDNEAFLVKVKPSHTVPFESQIVISGRTKATRHSEIKAEASNRVEAVYVEKGDRVKKGDLLLKLAEDSLPATYRAALAALERAQKNFEAVKNLSNSGYQSEIELLRAKEAVAMAQQQTAQAKIALDNTKIVAPFDGIMKSVTVELGDFVDVKSLIGEIIDLNPIEVVGFISEREYDKVHLGQKATAKLINHQEFIGVTNYIASSSDTRTGTFEIRVEFDNPAMSIPEGISADLTIFTADSLVHFLSKSALSLDENGVIGIKAVGEDNRVIFYPVEIIDDNKDGVYLAGLPEKLLVITSGQDFVKPESKITIEGESIQ